VHRVRAFLGADRVLIFRIQPNGQGDVIMESVGVGWISTLSCSIFDQCFNGDRYLPTYRQGKVTIQSDIETTGLEPCYVEFLQQYQVKAKLVAPILQNEHLWGLLIVHQCSETRVWQGDEVAAIQRITTQLGIAIQQAELYQQLETELKERQQAEQQIRQQTALLNQTNQLLELFIRYAPVGIAMFDRQMQYVAVSQRWVDEYHLGTIESILHRSHYDIFPDLPERWKVIHQRALAGGIEKCDEDLFIREDGQKQWISWEVHPWYDFTGNIGGIIIFSIDVTDHKVAGEILKSANEELELRVGERTIELQHSSDRLQLIWNITQKIRQSLNFSEILKIAVQETRKKLKADRVAVYRFNPDWSGDFIIESVGKQWKKLVGLLQKSWEDTYLQEHEGGRFRNQEIFKVNDIYNSDLYPCHVELLEEFQAKAYVVVPIFVGETLWGLLGVYQNSSTRIWQEDEVDLLQKISSQLAIAIQQSELYNQLQIELQEHEQAEAKIRETERRWRSLSENVQLLVISLDNQGTIEYINPFFLTLTGYLDSEIIGKNWFDTFIPAALQTEVRLIFSRLLIGQGDPHYQYPILTKADEERLITWNNTLLQDTNGRVIGTITIGQDITERKKIEAIKDEFIGIVSHELRTPLTAIQMSLGLLNTGVYATNPERANRMIEIAFTDTKRLVNLVNDILDLERLESSRTILEKKLCSAMELMEQTVTTLKAIAHQKAIEIIIVPTTLEVWAAPDSIIQTLANLLSNALKFSPDRSVIQLEANSHGCDTLFQVSD